LTKAWFGHIIALDNYLTIEEIGDRRSATRWKALLGLHADLQAFLGEDLGLDAEEN
jgi:hypothetical protein